MFTYGLIIYLVHRLKKSININFYSTMLFGIIGVILVDILIYVIYAVVDLTNMTFGVYLFIRLLPPTLANLILLIICYLLLKGRFLPCGNDLVSTGLPY